MFWLAIIVAIVQDTFRVAAAPSRSVARSRSAASSSPAMIRRPWAYRAGGALQVLAIACGFVVPVDVRHRRALRRAVDRSPSAWVTPRCGARSSSRTYVGRPPTPLPTSGKSKVP